MEGLARRLSTGAPTLPAGVMDMAANLNLNLLQKATSQVQRCTSLVIFPSSTKTIPFTVPAGAAAAGGNTGSPGPRTGVPGSSSSRFQGTEDTGSTGSTGSDPPSPSSSSAGLQKGSLESLGSSGHHTQAGTPSGALEFRGK